MKDLNHPVRRGGLFIVLLSVTLITALVFWQTRRGQLAAFSSQFQRDAAERTAFIRQGADKSLLAVKSLAWFFDGAGRMDRQSFQAFAAACLLERRELQALSWNPRVPAGERAVWEERARREGLQDFQLSERGPDGHQVNASKRDTYYPVLYIEPMNGNDTAVGFDVGSEPVRREALERARDTAEPAATEPIRLVQQEGGELGFLIFVPIYRPGVPTASVPERRSALNGFAVGVYRAGTMVTAALGGVEPLGLSQALLDRSAPVERQLMYRWKDTSKGNRSWKSLFWVAPPQATYSYSFAGRRWGLEVRAGPAYMERYCPVSYWLVWPAGMLLGWLATRSARTMLSSRQRLAHLVGERTAELRQTQQMLQLVLDAIPVGVHWKNRDSVYLGCNRRVAEDAELHSAEEIVGKTDFNLPWRQYAELYRGRDRKVLESGEPLLDYEQPRSTSEGHTRTLLQSKLPLRDGQGVIIGVLSVYEDISERKRAEEALRASESRLRFALEGANDGLWDVDFRSGRVLLSPRGCEILGYQCEEFGMSVDQWHQMVHPSDLPATLAALQAHLDGTSSLFAVEQRLRTKSGEWKWVLVRGKVAEFGPDGKPVRMTGTHSDISARKEAEMAMRESESRYRAVVENSCDGIVVAVENKVVYLNPAAVRLAGGKQAGDLLGRSVLDFVPEDDRAATEARRAKMLETGRPSPLIEGKLQRPDGGLVDAEWIGVPIEYGGRRAILNSFRDVTENRRRAQALRASEAKYRRLHESMMDAFVAIDFEGRLTDCNESFRKMIGYEPEEIRRVTYQDFTPEKWHALDTEFRQAQVFPRGYSDIYEKEYRRKDGTLFPVELRVVLLRDDAGLPCGTWAIVRDVTERKHAEAALRQSREQLRERAEELETIMGSAPVALWVAHDPQCNSISGNRMANSFEPASPQANWSANVSSAFQWFRDGRQLKPEELPMQQAARENRGIYNTEMELLLPGGRRVSLLGSAVPLREDGGQVRGCVGAFLDNTERKQAEYLLAGEKQVLEWIARRKPLPAVLNELCRFIEELSPGVMASVMLLDAEGTLLRPIAAPKLPEAWTRAITPVGIGPAVGSCGTAAWGKKQVVVSDIASDPRWTGYPDYCALALKCGLRACWSTPILSADGSSLGTFAMYYPEPCSPQVRDLEIIKQLTHLASVAIEHDRAAEALRQARDELEQRVRERTAELVQANRRLEELDRLKSQFLATMSHELRTPLNSIIGFTGILGQGFAGPVNDEQKKQLGMVFSSAKHLLSLINDLLDLSRIEAGKVDIEREPFNFVEVVEEVIQSLRPLASHKNLTLGADLPGPTLSMLGDRKRSYQVLLNLANNAVKFTDRGEVKITVGAREDQLRVCVADTGIGIKPEQMGMLFEAFRQLDGTAKRIYEGTGLGLHLCRRLLTLMGGEVGVESEFGKGSRFFFTLPRRLGPSARTAGEDT